MLYTIQYLLQKVSIIIISSSSSGQYQKNNMKNANNRKNRRLQILRRQLTAASGPFNKVLIANRGEIAIRVARAAAGLNIQLLCYAKEDALSLHTRQTQNLTKLAQQKKMRLQLMHIWILKQLLLAKAVVQMLFILVMVFYLKVGFVKRCEEENIKFIGPSSAPLHCLVRKLRRESEHNHAMSLLFQALKMFFQVEAVCDFINSSDN